MNDKYLYFGDVCIDGKIQCEESYKVGLQLYNELSSIEKERIKRGKKAKASWELAHASETALKAFLIYTEFTKMPIFNNPITINRNNGDNRILIRREKDRNQNIADVYSTGFYPGYKDNNEIWKKLLDGRRDELTPSEQSMFSDGKSFSMISNPKTLLTSIRQNALEGDFRLDSNFMINDPIHSYDFTKNISGHDLFAYLKISNPTIQGIINNELFLLGDKFDKLEKIIGILEGYGNDSIQNNISQENIYTNSLAFPKKRFNWITGEDVDNDDLKSILDFAKINLDIAEFKFPGNDVDKFEHIVNLDFSEYNNTVFNCLDPICKYYVKQYFTNEEINTIDSIAKMKRLNPSDIVMFVNMCVYYKYNIRVILDEKSQLLNFDKSEHANNLLIHTNNMKTYDANGTRKLEDSSIFTSNIENISKVIEKIKQEKSLQTETNSNDKNLEEIIKICETNKIIPNDIILKKTPEDVKKIIEICKNNKIEISGSIFRKSAEEIEKIIAICNANKIYPTRSMFLKNPEEIQKTIDICKNNNVEIIESIFRKPANEIEKTIDVCNKNNIKITDIVFHKTSEEIEKIIEVCNRNNIEIISSLFMKTSKEIEEIINICRDHNIEVTKSIFFRTPEEIKRIIQKGITNEISPFKKQEEIQETIDMCKNNNVEIPESISFEKPEKIQEEINLWGKNNIGLIDTGKLPENGEYINKIR